MLHNLFQAKHIRLSQYFVTNAIYSEPLPQVYKF